MLLKKAIEILENHQADMPRNEVPDLIDAIKLGIEGLKRLRTIRTPYREVGYSPLPGETK